SSRAALDANRAWQCRKSSRSLSRRTFHTFSLISSFVFSSNFVATKGRPKARQQMPTVPEPVPERESKTVSDFIFRSSVHGDPGRFHRVVTGVDEIVQQIQLPAGRVGAWPYGVADAENGSIERGIHPVAGG